MSYSQAAVSAVFFSIHLSHDHTNREFFLGLQFLNSPFASLLDPLDCSAIIT